MSTDLHVLQESFCCYFIYLSYLFIYLFSSREANISVIDLLINQICVRLTNFIFETIIIIIIIIKGIHFFIKLFNQYVIQHNSNTTVTFIFEFKIYIICKIFLYSVIRKQNCDIYWFVIQYRLFFYRMNRSC